MTTRAKKTIPRNTTKRASKPSSHPEVPMDVVRARAYEIYLARGERPGDAVSDWYQAERELTGSAKSI